MLAVVEQLPQVEVPVQRHDRSLAPSRGIGAEHGQRSRDTHRILWERDGQRLRRRAHEIMHVIRERLQLADHDGCGVQLGERAADPCEHIRRAGGVEMPKRRAFRARREQGAGLGEPRQRFGHAQHAGVERVQHVEPLE